MRLDTSRLVNVKRQADGSIQCQCPICFNEDGRDKVGRNHLRVFRSGAFHCIVDDSKDHNRRIRAYLRGTSLDDNPEEEIIDPEPTIQSDKVYPESVLSKLIPDYSYWVGRGIREDVLKRLECGVAAKEEKSKLSGRSVFPIRGTDGRIVGFSGRLIEDNSFAPKYKHMFKSSRVCWPWHITGPAIRATQTAVLVEGASDLVTLMSHDIDNVLSLFGLNLNGKIISTLVANDVRRVVISLNRDEDPSKGQRAAERIADRLGAFFAPDNVIIRLPPEGVKDWGLASSDQIVAFRAELAAQPIS